MFVLMKHAINHRVELLISEKKMNPNSFSVAIKQLPQTTNKILKGLNKPGFDYINSILTTFVDISAQWLLTGVGEMFLKEEKFNLPNEIYSKTASDTAEIFKEYIVDLKEKLKEKNEKISQLESELNELKGKIKTSVKK